MPGRGLMGRKTRHFPSAWLWEENHFAGPLQTDWAHCTAELSGARTHSDTPLLLSSQHGQVTLVGVVHVCSHGREEKPGHVPTFCRRFWPCSSCTVYPPSLTPGTLKTFLSVLQVLPFQTQRSAVNSNTSWERCLLYFCWLRLQALQVLCLAEIYFVWGSGLSDSLFYCNWQNKYCHVFVFDFFDIDLVFWQTFPGIAKGTLKRHW